MMNSKLEQENEKGLVGVIIWWLGTFMLGLLIYELTTLHYIISVMIIIAASVAPFSTIFLNWYNWGVAKTRAKNVILCVALLFMSGAVIYAILRIEQIL